MKKKVEVGGSLREEARCFAAEWDLLRHLHAHPEPGIRPLSRALGRGDKRVYEDVKALKLVRLIEERDGMLHAGYDEIQTSIRVVDVA